MEEKLYQFCVYKVPTEAERKEGKRTELIVPPSEWFIATAKEALMRANKAIPEDQMKFAAQLEVAVRPF